LAASDVPQQAINWLTDWLTTHLTTEM
jgi:hypothetical protein